MCNWKDTLWTKKNDIEWSIPRHRQVSHRFSKKRTNPWGMEEEICSENRSVGKNHVVLGLGAGGSLAKSPGGGSVDPRVSHLLQQWFKQERQQTLQPYQIWRYKPFLEMYLSCLPTSAVVEVNKERQPKMDKRATPIYSEDEVRTVRPTPERNSSAGRLFLFLLFWNSISFLCIPPASLEHRVIPLP